MEPSLNYNTAISDINRYALALYSFAEIDNICRYEMVEEESGINFKPLLGVWKIIPWGGNSPEALKESYKKIKAQFETSLNFLIENSDSTNAEFINKSLHVIKESIRHAKIKHKNNKKDCEFGTHQFKKICLRDAAAIIALAQARLIKKFPRPQSPCPTSPPFDLSPISAPSVSEIPLPSDSSCAISQSTINQSVLMPMPVAPQIDLVTPPVTPAYSELLPSTVGSITTTTTTTTAPQEPAKTKKLARLELKQKKTYSPCRHPGFLVIESKYDTSTALATVDSEIDPKDRQNLTIQFNNLTTLKDACKENWKNFKEAFDHFNSSYQKYSDLFDQVERLKAEADALIPATASTSAIPMPPPMPSGNMPPLRVGGPPLPPPMPPIGQLKLKGAAIKPQAQLVIWNERETLTLRMVNAQREVVNCQQHLEECYSNLCNLLFFKFDSTQEGYSYENLKLAYEAFLKDVQDLKNFKATHQLKPTISALSKSALQQDAVSGKGKVSSKKIVLSPLARAEKELNTAKVELSCAEKDLLGNAKKLSASLTDADLKASATALEELEAKFKNFKEKVEAVVKLLEQQKIVYAEKIRGATSAVLDRQRILAQKMKQGDQSQIQKAQENIQIAEEKKAAAIAENQLHIQACDVEIERLKSELAQKIEDLDKLGLGNN